MAVGRVAVDALLGAADEIHVATSQLGFEAVLRGRPVRCYGLPFYAGWGLTQDLVAPPRPRRRLPLDALVAGALILYPKYLSWERRLPCEVEDVLAEFTGARAEASALRHVFSQGE
jgi:capsular polysaccharide export protein